MRSVRPRFYKDEIHYTGWFPDAYSSGVGIAVIDRNTVRQGLWKQNSMFPREGATLSSPEGYEYEERNVSYLSNREGVDYSLD